MKFPVDKIPPKEICGYGWPVLFHSSDLGFEFYGLVINSLVLFVVIAKFAPWFERQFGLRAKDDPAKDAEKPDG